MPDTKRALVAGTRRSLIVSTRPGLIAAAPGSVLVALLALLCCLMGVATASGEAAHSMVAYGSSAEQVMSVYPAARPGAPICVLAHGGGWTTNTLAKMSNVARDLQRGGCAVFNADYRLASASRPAFPMQVEDVEAATRYAIAHGVAYDGNPANVIEIGSSAGGTLAALASERMDGTAPGTIAGTVTLSGPMELGSLLIDDVRGELVGRFAQDVPLALGCSLLNGCVTPEGLVNAARWSPAAQMPTLCPGSWLVFNSSKELMPRDQPAAITSALQAKGCAVTTTILPGHRHANEYWASVEPSALGFVQSH